MKTVMFWLMGLALLTVTGCKGYLTEEEAHRIYLPRADADATYATNSKLQLVAQGGLEQDQAFDDKLGGLQTQVTNNKEDLQGQIDGLKVSFECLSGTLTTVQGDIDALRAAGVDVDQIRTMAETLQCELGQLKERMGDVDPRQLATEVNELKGRANVLAAEMCEVKGRLGTVEQVAGAASRKSDLATLQEEVRRLTDRQRGTAESLEQARQNLQADVSRLGDQQRGTAENLEAERRERARIAEQLRLEKLNRFARQYPWEGDDFYQVVDRHQNAARSGPTRIFIQKKDGSVVAEVFVWASYQGRPYSTGARELRSVIRQGDVLVYDGYDAGGWPCQHRIPAELFPSLNLALFDSPARRP